MLPTLGKELEFTIADQLTAHLEEEAPLSQHQYGFRHHCSTEDCMHAALEALAQKRKQFPLVAAASLDIREAFPTLPWNHIHNELRRRQVPGHLCNIMHSYLSNRWVTCGGQAHQLEVGCPMGSILRPLLWNIGYDAILRKLQDRGVSTFCYADDTLILIGETTVANLVELTVQEIERTSADMREIGLEFNERKTSILVFNCRPARIRRDPQQPEITFHLQSGVEIRLKKLSILVCFVLEEVILAIKKFQLRLSC